MTMKNIKAYIQRKGLPAVVALTIIALAAIAVLVGFVYLVIVGAWPVVIIMGFFAAMFSALYVAETWQA